jgi:hypothetical protein
MRQHIVPETAKLHNCSLRVQDQAFLPWTRVETRGTPAWEPLGLRFSVFHPLEDIASGLPSRPANMK